MKLLFALGNPGDRYRDTRHNAGWWLADHLADRWGLGRFRVDGGVAAAEGRVETEPVLVAKPLSFMNLTGRVLPGLLDRHAVDPSVDLLVLVDDVSLAPGRFRLRAQGSAGGHNGLASVASNLDSQAYARLRIGVGSPASADVDLAAWVLDVPRDDEEHLVLERFDPMAEAVECWIAEGIETAMNEFN